MVTVTSCSIAGGAEEEAEVEGATQEQAIGCQEPRFEHSEDKENDNPALLTNKEQKEQKDDSAELPSLAAIQETYAEQRHKIARLVQQYHENLRGELVCFVSTLFADAVSSWGSIGERVFVILDKQR